MESSPLLYENRKTFDYSIKLIWIKNFERNKTVAFFLSKNYETLRLEGRFNDHYKN